jgi:hypothetical protein
LKQQALSSSTRTAGVPECGYESGNKKGISQKSREYGFVITNVNGTPLSKSEDFEGVIARFAPGSVIYLTTLRDGELFDRTITLGYGRCPSGLSASNLAASQPANAFPSLKKPTKLFDAGQLTPGAPLLLSSIRHLIDQSARLKNEVNSTLLAIGKFDDEINCTLGVLGPMEQSGRNARRALHV